MRIAQVAPPFEAVPPRRYGGTERVVATLTETLVARGHQVTLFAPGDSRTSAELVPIVERALWRSADPGTDLAPYCAVAFGALASRIGDFDVVHNHLDYWGFALAAVSNVPVLTTLHGRLDFPAAQLVFQNYRSVPLVSISDAQRGPVPWANFQATIHHGIETSAFTPRVSVGGGEYVAWIGRIAPEKGLDIAIRVAARAHKRLKIAAREPLRFTRDREAIRERRYFEQVIRPLLGQDHVELVGEVDGPAKNDLLVGAEALLFPIQWPEPFGLVMAEALACGTPVVALDRGSVPEVIEHGVTGYVCADEAELVEALARVNQLDRRVCRRAAESRFSAAIMAEAYEHVYFRLLRGREPISLPERARARIQAVSGGAILSEPPDRNSAESAT